MIILWLAGLAIVLAFGSALISGAPYLPTLNNTCAKALELLELKKGQTLIDLGCGDGVMLKLAAQKGLKAVGYEINPFLVIIARLRTLSYRRQVEVKWGNFWSADITRADGVYVFLLDRYMARLGKKLQAELRPGVKVASHAFEIPRKKPFRKSGALFLYKY